MSATVIEHESKALVAVEPEQDMVQLGVLRTTPELVIERAASIATALGAVIEKQVLYKQIRNKKYVVVEGWSTLGAMLGVLPREEWSREQPDGSWEAYVNLVRTSDGQIVGGASAICGMDENDGSGALTWANRARYARRSMAITRATGKAYRLSFSWIMALAGYMPTPAEEMSTSGNETEDAKQEWWTAVRNALCDGTLLPRDAHANHLASLLKMLEIAVGDDLPIVIEKVELYRGVKVRAEQDETKVTNREAADWALEKFRQLVVERGQEEERAEREGEVVETLRQESKSDEEMALLHERAEKGSEALFGPKEGKP